MNPSNQGHDDNQESVDSASDCRAKTPAIILIYYMESEIMSRQTSGIFSISDDGFLDVSDISSVTEFVVVPQQLKGRKVLSLAEEAFQDADSLKCIILPEGLESLGACCFAGCRKLTSVILPKTLKDIGDYCFDGCEGLTSMSIPESVEIIGEGAFFGCSGIVSIDFPASIKQIRNHTFFNCTRLLEFKIRESISSIGSYAFFGCSSINTITIPNSVKYIENDAFMNCTKLETIYYLGSSTQWAKVCAPISARVYPSTCNLQCLGELSVEMEDSVNNL